LGDSWTDSCWSDGHGPILQAYPFCESSTPEKKKKKKKAKETNFEVKKALFCEYFVSEISLRRRRRIY
jgi:hypothetical protein